MQDDFIFKGKIADWDLGLHELLLREKKRQDETIILIPSESAAPDAVRHALTSVFGNIYAEGYPKAESRRQTEEEILDFEAEVAHYRRYSDPRYYKGVEYADILEALTRRRAAELFAANGVMADDLYVNVQPLSGAPANSAVYTALLKPGDTIMGLNLNDGGHLTHGSRVNRSGQVFNGVPYFVDQQTEQLDYDAIEAQALAVRPQIIVAGYSAYPFVVDWDRFRAIADKAGAYLLADISHISGLVASGMHPSPIGIADIVTTTTHKSLCGPRGAMIITHKRLLARKLDRAVFPGEQGGAHFNTIAALAIALKFAKSRQFVALQKRIVKNAARLAEQLERHGLRVVGGRTENHLLLIDTKSAVSGDPILTGDMAARLLDLVGIVTNRNTIPGDKSAFQATGVRIGTVWISQLGYDTAEIDLLAEAIATILLGAVPYSYEGLGGKRSIRAKVKPEALTKARQIVAQLTGVAPEQSDHGLLLVRGEDAMPFLQMALTQDISQLEEGEDLCGYVVTDQERLLVRVYAEEKNRYLLQFVDGATAVRARRWLMDLSDGYILFDADLQGKLPGPVVVEWDGLDRQLPTDVEAVVAYEKPYFIGHDQFQAENSATLPIFKWIEPAEGALLKTSLHQTHIDLGAKMVPFGGWDMPVWYSSVTDEHDAVRNAAGLFDVSHMGVFEASGPNAEQFLNLVTSNDVSKLRVGQSHYTYFLGADGEVIDDLLVYRRGAERFMAVVNASNNDKDWAWLNGVNRGELMIDEQRPFARFSAPCELKDLRDLQWDAECRVDIALQGPKATEILLGLCTDHLLAQRIKGLLWGELTEGVIADDIHLVVSRTGYTGERVAYELFVHPDKAVALWNHLLRIGTAKGLKPTGLAARDSTRTEAGLPLYGHELAGPLQLSPPLAGFGNYLKSWKRFFIGREPFLAKEAKRTDSLVRFRMNEKGVRRAELGDPILDKRGKVVGWVTSCAIDQEGYLLGQAVVPNDMAAVDTQLFIYQLGGGERSLNTAAQLKLGARLPVPAIATVLTRFPSRKKK